MRFLLRIAEQINKKAAHARWKRRIGQLVSAGMKIGNNVIIEAGAYIDQRSPFLIEIGDNCAFAHGCRILAHDATPYKYTGGHTRLGRVHIKENCFIAEHVVILPGVTIGPNVLIAAGSVVNKDIPPNSCVAGVPARFYSKFDEMIERHRAAVKERPVFAHQDLYYGDHAKVKAKATEAVKDGDIYVKGFIGTYPDMWNPTSEHPQ